MRHKVLALCAAAAVVLTVLVGGDRYLARHTTKIDEEVTLVRVADDTVLVIGPRQQMRLTKVRPDVTPPRDIKPDPTKLAPKQPAAPVKWTLPYSCSDVRYYNSHFTPTQLDAMRKAAGMAMPTADQRTQIQACIAGRIK